MKRSAVVTVIALGALSGCVRASSTPILTAYSTTPAYNPEQVEAMCGYEASQAYEASRDVIRISKPKPRYETTCTGVGSYLNCDTQKAAGGFAGGFAEGMAEAMASNPAKGPGSYRQNEAAYKACAARLGYRAEFN